ncbi:MAG: cache domain-containing protein [Spirochaetales bacterium]|nr:cache domain-containing protein [Spirochaetales bacterium]
MYFALILVFATMLIILISLAGSYRQNLIDMRKKELQRQVSISLNTITPIINSYENGSISKDEAIEQVRELVRRMTYRSETMNNYVFMSTYGGIMLVQPLEPSLEGTYQLEARDSDGNYYIKDLINAAQSPEGQGFVTYKYPPPGTDNPGEKLSYVIGLPSLECYLGTGMFFNDIDFLFKKYLLGPSIVILASFISILLMMFIYLQPLTSCLKIILDTFHGISVQPETCPLVPVNQFSTDSDEYEILNRFEGMLESVFTYRQELHQSEQKYRLLYEESQGVRILLDRKGAIRDVNNSFASELGFCKEELIGQSLVDLTLSITKETILHIIGMSFSETYTHAEDIDIYDSSGKVRTILFSESFILPEFSDQILLTGVDITNRKIAERQSEMQREQLVQADKFSSLGILVAGVAHEINNPNQFIMSNADLVTGFWKDIRIVLDEYYDSNGDFSINGFPYLDLREKVPGYLNGLTEGAERIDKIVRDLKIYSRNDEIESRVRVDLNNIIEASINLCFNLIKNSTDNLTVLLDKKLPDVWGNSQRLEQVIINLIQNACEALEKRTDALTISSTFNDVENSVEIKIEDKGLGIPLENMDKICLPLFSTNREKGGTGLGLSVSKGIVGEHNGKLLFSSEPDEGTTVLLILPAAE